MKRKAPLKKGVLAKAVVSGAELGLTAREVADLVGTSPESVRTAAYYLKVVLKKEKSGAKPKEKRSALDNPNLPDRASRREQIKACMGRGLTIEETVSELGEPWPVVHMERFEIRREMRGTAG